MVSPVSLGLLEDLVLGTGDLVMKHYGSVAAAELKADRSPITAADRASHDNIVRALRAIAPEVPIISEEGEIPPYEERQSWSQFWLVDPLDGTKEFLQQNGEFTINIALIEDGVPVQGVVYAPALDVLYLAERGLGSFKQEPAAGTQRMKLFGPYPPGPDGVVIVESRSHPSPELEAYLGTFKVAKREKAGSSLKFCLVAEGRAHLYPRFGPTMEWDVAAGDAIWRYASKSGERPSPLTYNTPELRNSGFVIGVAA